MTKSKYENPRTKVRARPDHKSTFVTTIPSKISHAMRMQPGDELEWIWVTEGFQSFIKIVKVQS